MKPLTVSSGIRLQTPTLIGCKFLKNHKNILPLLLDFTVISEAFDYDTVLINLSNFLSGFYLFTADKLLSATSAF